MEDRGSVQILSCVGGGPMVRLARELQRAGIPATVESLYAPQQWRSLFSKGRLGRIRARAGSMFAFPARSIAQAIVGPHRSLVATTNPFYLPVMLVATRALHRRPIVALVYDLYPDALAVGPRKSPRLVDAVAKAANRYLFRHADGVVFIGETMAAYATTAYGEPQRMTVIETGATTAEFSTANVGGAAAESELERFCDGRVTLSYVGNMGHVHDIETLAEALPRWLEGDGGARRAAVIAASGPGSDVVKERWAGVSDDVLRFSPPLGDREWARLLVRSDIAIATLKQDAWMTSIPSKAFSAMAAGSAIVAVAPARSDLARLVERHACGAVVEPGDIDGLHAALTLLSAPDALARAKANAKAAAEEHYDLPRLAHRWREFLFNASSATHSAVPAASQGTRA